MSRVHLILMAVKWQIESSAILWILGIVSYLLCSSTIYIYKKSIHTHCMLFVFLLLRIAYPCCGVTPCAFSVPFITWFKSLLLYFHFLDLMKLRILNIFFTFSMSWNAEGKKFQICMKCSIFHTDVLNWRKKNLLHTFALRRNLFYSLHIKPNKSHIFVIVWF